MYTTLNRIKAYEPCKESWKRGLAAIGRNKASDTPVSFLQILEISGFMDAVWCMRSAPGYEKEWRLFGVFCCRQIACYFTPLAIEAVNVAERYAHGQSTFEELNRIHALMQAEVSSRKKPFHYKKATASAAAFYLTRVCIGYSIFDAVASLGANLSEMTHAERFALRDAQKGYLHKLFSNKGD